MYFLLEKVDFHCQVSLPEGKLQKHIPIHLTWFQGGGDLSTRKDLVA